MDNIGKIIKNFYCKGFFGRRYDLTDSVIEGEGRDWIVIRLPDGTADIAFFRKGFNKQELIDKWCDPEYAS